MEQIRWNIAVSAETDKALRLFLTLHGGGKKGDLSRFIEQAVRAQILELTADQVKKNNSDVSENELDSAVDEALHWARSQYVIPSVFVTEIL